MRSIRVSILLVVTIVAVLMTVCAWTLGEETADTAPPSSDAVAASSAARAPVTHRPAAPRPAPAAAVQGITGSPADRLAVDVVTGVEQFWREELPARFGRPWRDIRAFVAADPRDAANPPPCLRRSLDLSNQALYCPVMDTVAWDRARLVPELRAEYGDAAVVVALAHEIGHAVQDRLGIDGTAQQREPGRWPTILLEGMADCFSGVVLDAVAHGRIAGLSAGPDDVDRALRALLTFRDPVGAAPGHGAHGNAFDRAAAFVSGYHDGAEACAAMSVEHSTFTQRAYRSPADASRDGNLTLGVLLSTLGPDARDWFDRMATARGRPATDPSLLSEARCVTGGLDGLAPGRPCPDDVPAGMPTDLLRSVYERYGDYASATVMVSRYALATLASLGRPVLGPEAGRSAVCLTGAYTHELLGRDRDRDRGFTLSPGDLDEAVDTLLADDHAARDAAGRAPEGDLGMDRVWQFRAGALGGVSGCGL